MILFVLTSIAIIVTIIDLSGSIYGLEPGTLSQKTIVLDIVWAVLVVAFAELCIRLGAIDSSKVNWKKTLYSALVSIAFAAAFLIATEFHPPRIVLELCTVLLAINSVVAYWSLRLRK